jgi:hypothetical protein
MTVILGTLVVYQLLMLAIGWWASKRNRDSEDFYLGGRRLGGLVAADLADPRHGQRLPHQLVPDRAAACAAQPGG